MCLERLHFVYVSKAHALKHPNWNKASYLEKSRKRRKKRIALSWISFMMWSATVFSPNWPFSIPFPTIVYNSLIILAWVGDLPALYWIKCKLIDTESDGHFRNLSKIRKIAGFLSPNPIIITRDANSFHKWG